MVTGRLPSQLHPVTGRLPSQLHQSPNTCWSDFNWKWKILWKCGRSEAGLEMRKASAQCGKVGKSATNIFTTGLLYLYILYCQGSTLSFLAGCPKSHFLGWYKNFFVYWYSKPDNQVVNSTCPKDKLGWIWWADDPYRTLTVNTMFHYCCHHREFTSLAHPWTTTLLLWIQGDVTIRAWHPSQSCWLLHRA